MWVRACGSRRRCRGAGRRGAVSISALDFPASRSTTRRPALGGKRYDTRHSTPCFALYWPLAAIAAASAVVWLLGVPPVAQQKPRALPAFAVDPSWPKVPDNYKLGDISSIALDAQDNAYVLHRPRTLKPEDAAKAAPAVFDPAGNFIRAWGGPGPGLEWPEREHGIHIDHKGFAWIGGNQCPTSGNAGLKHVADDQLLKFTLDGKFVLQIGKSNQSKGDADTANVHRAADAWVPPNSNEVHIATDSKGNLYIAQTGAGMQRLLFKGMSGAAVR